ncbi:MAG: hypothetical protein U1G07_20510 [Verrucomicrobiota bacterium]
MLFLAGIVVTVCFALMGREYWLRLFGPGSPLGSPSFSSWLRRGLLLPIGLWLFLNTGWLTAWPPLLVEIARTQAKGGSSWPLIFTLPIPGALAIGSYWLAVTFLHLNVLIGLRAESRVEFWIVTGILALVALPFVWLTCAVGGLAWAGIGLLLWLLPVAHCTGYLVARSSPQPIYAKAIARMKLGKYREAESEVIQQLEICQEDFDGWMMLAELYAAQFNDLAEADRTVRSVCAQPSATPLQISLALHRLADWQLKFGNDPVAANEALLEVTRRLPGTHFAKMAEVRRRQLPATRQEWIEGKQPKKVRLPALTGDLEEVTAPAGPRLSRSDAAALANECVEQLKRNPNQTGPREKFATLLVEELGKVDLGLEQAQLLLEVPGIDERKKAEWLSRMARWQWRYKRDAAVVKETLKRLIRDHATTVEAFAAQRWLNLLEMEERLQRRIPSAG